MHTVFRQKELLNLLQSFHTLTGLRAVVFDECGMDILSYPPELPDFCKLVRSTECGKSGCMLCDQNACRMALREQGTVIYPCHAGLIEMITPIQVENSVVGYLLLSHIVQGTDEEAEWTIVQERCCGYGIDPDALFAAYQALPRTPEKYLMAGSDILNLAAKAIYQQRLACLVPDDWRVRLNQFLEEHISEDLSCDRLCREFGVSRTNLYHMARKTFGCGISEHIASLRIRRAMELLAETQMSPGRICEAVGIRDYNYFFRIFRRRTGLTPVGYRLEFSQTNKKPPMTV